MPVMNGYQATKTIRSSSHPNAKSIPIFAMTADAFTENVAEALSAGMNGHIAKPIDTHILYRTLCNCLSRHKIQINSFGIMRHFFLCCKRYFRSK